MTLARVIALSLLTVQAPLAATPINPLQLKPDHVTASVSDLHRAEQWYRRMLGFGFRQRGEHGGVQFVELGIPGFGISLVQEPARGQVGADGPRNVPRWVHIVFSVPNVARAYEILKSEGAVPVPRKQANGHIQSFLIMDSEGNELEVTGRSAP